MIAICDECKEQFNVKFKEKIIGIGVIKHYFTCPYCKHEYINFIKNSSVRKKQRQIKKLYAELRKTKSFKERQLAIFTIEKAEREVKREMDQLKEQYS